MFTNLYPKKKYLERVEDTDESDANINDIAQDDDVNMLVEQVFQEAEVLRSLTLTASSANVLSSPNEANEYIHPCLYKCGKMCKKMA